MYFALLLSSENEKEIGIIIAIAFDDSLPLRNMSFLQ